VTEVDVSVADSSREIVAGTLYAHRRRGTESANFTYRADYVASPDAYAVDPGLPLRLGVQQTPVGTRLFGGFADSAPDRWGRTLIDRREAALAKEEGRTPRSLAEIDYLLGVRDDLRQGALRFRQPEGPYLADDATGVPLLTDLPTLLDLADRADRDTADLPDLQRLVRVAGSLGGARPKAHVLNADRRLGIAKFPSARSDAWNVMAWEKVVLDLARDAGITVPDSTLMQLAGRSVLVIDRFDRDPVGNRRGYASAMTMLQATDREQRSYLEIAEVIDTHSPRASDELEQLWRRIVLNVLVSNTDDHLRNHGFLHTRGDAWQLAPAFDLNPEPGFGAKYLSTAIDAADTSASLRLVLDVADYFRLSATRARDVAAEVARSVENWRQVASRHGLDDDACERMAGAFSVLDDVQGIV
jgi:serine/threonine-protein kinase HipA